jgi:hypothetical protein
MIAAAGITIVYNEQLDRTLGKGVTMEGKRITAITMLSGKTYHGKMFIDASYVGDLGGRRELHRRTRTGEPIR